MQNKKIKIKLTYDKIKDFVITTNKFTSDIDVLSDRVVIDGKSILGMYALDLSQDIYVKIISNDLVECRKFEAEMIEHFKWKFEDMRKFEV